MISVVEFMLNGEFADLRQLKSIYLMGISEYLSRMGYDVVPVDRSEWYSYEHKLLVDTDAPETLINHAIDVENKKNTVAMGLLVR